MGSYCMAQFGRRPSNLMNSHSFNMHGLASARGRRKSRSAAPVSATRASLCGGMRVLQERKDQLRELTSRQRQELQAIDDDFNDLHTRQVEAKLAKAEYVCGSYADRCTVDALQIELRALEAERQQLEQDLSLYRSSAASARDATVLDAWFDSERADWEGERRFLEHELANAHAELTHLQEDIIRRRQAATMAEAEQQRLHIAKLREKFVLQREQREQAERHLQDGQLALKNSHTEPFETARSRQHLEGEKAKLAALRRRVVLETEERQTHGPQLQDALNELDRLRRELHEVLIDNGQLRTSLQRSLRGLDYISQQTSDAKYLAKASLP